MKRLLIFLLLGSNVVLFSQDIGDKIKISEQTYMYINISSFDEQVLLPAGTNLIIVKNVNEEGYYFVSAEKSGAGFIAGPIIDLEYQNQKYKDEETDNESYIFVSVGGSYLGGDPQDASHGGISFGVGLGHLYFDFATNLAAGEGEYSDYTSNSSQPTDKVNLFVLNGGYIFNINSTISITPLIGLGCSSQVMEESEYWQSYSYLAKKQHFNLGLKTDLYFSPNAGITLGIGTFEYFKGGLILRF